MLTKSALVALLGLITSCAIAGAQAPGCTHESDAAGAQGAVPLDDREAASEVLKTRLLAAGRAGLERLTHASDSMVALHAEWEIVKGNSMLTSRFVTAFEERLGARPPTWWRERLAAVVVYPRCHYVPSVDQLGIPPRARARCGDNDVACEASYAGFPYVLQMFVRSTGAQVWSSCVWATGRDALMGKGVHALELVVSGDRVFVFGAESHGLYAEVFRLEGGTPVFRFCSSYWSDYSEQWAWR